MKYVVVRLFQVPNVKYVVVRLYQERLQQIDAKLEEVKEGRAVEYLNPLAQLEENMSIYTEVAGRRTTGLYAGSNSCQSHMFWWTCGC